MLPNPNSLLRDAILTKNIEAISTLIGKRARIDPVYF